MNCYDNNYICITTGKVTIKMPRNLEINQLRKLMQVERDKGRNPNELLTSKIILDEIKCICKSG